MFLSFSHRQLCVYQYMYVVGVVRNAFIYTGSADNVETRGDVPGAAQRRLPVEQKQKREEKKQNRSESSKVSFRIDETINRPWKAPCGTRPPSNATTVPSALIISWIRLRWGERKLRFHLVLRPSRMIK